MEIIPVIDLLDGKVVRAERGERSRYRPIRSQLCDSCEPLEIARALLELYPFATLYIADLDAIQRRGSNAGVITQLARHYPHVTFWVDVGLSHAADWPYADIANIRSVIASEALADSAQYIRMSQQLVANRPILSLDFDRNGAFMGPAALQQPSHWPQTLLCMTLARVGSYQGPDIERLAVLRAQAPECALYAAGGIRDSDDMQQLKRLGIAGVLIASTLHDGRIGTAQLAALQA